MGLGSRLDELFAGTPKSFVNAALGREPGTAWGGVVRPNYAGRRRHQTPLPVCPYLDQEFALMQLESALFALCQLLKDLKRFFG